MTDNKRIFYLDNLKVFLIILVVLHHVGQAYGSTGGTWFYSYPGERVQSLGLFFLFNASFFMGLFFFISGYFLPSSFDRHGSGKFITDKLTRFGIPLAFAAFIMVPLLTFVSYIRYVNPVNFLDFYKNVWLGFSADAGAQYRLNFGHLWFIEHLLVYSVIYAIGRLILKRLAPSLAFKGTMRIKLYPIIIYVICLGLVTNIIRTIGGFPMDRWIAFLGFIQTEPAHIPQYLSLFILGILSNRRSLLDSITKPEYMLWLVPGLGIFLMTIILVFCFGTEKAFFGWEFSEALLCTGVCIGLLALFKTFFNRSGLFVKLLSENTYGVYVFHVPVAVALQYTFDSAKLSALSLFFIVSVLSVTGSFLISYLIRLVPGVKKIL